MKYAVDKIEGNVVVLENINDKTIKNVDIKEFNFELQESDIVIYDGKNYIKDDLYKSERLNSIRQKMNRLKDNS